MELQEGICPHCENPGSTGDACDQELCQRKSYRYIPCSAFDTLREIPYEERDPLFGRQIDDYLIIGELGEGGFGKVYLALQMPIFMPTAFKLMLRRNADPQIVKMMIRRFHSEALSLAKLRHPNIVKLMKYGSFLDRPYIVMEYVDNASTLEQMFREFRQQEQGFELNVLQRILEQILNALESAHDQKVVHRDLKPDNIMLQQVTGEESFVRVLDFGLAKIVEGSLRTTMMAGTPAYMAPEQLGGRRIGPWTDIYAFGVIVFELLTGFCPFPGDTVEAIIGQKVDWQNDPLKRPPITELPAALLTFCSKTFHMQPEERFQTIAECRPALDAVFEELTKTGLNHTGDGLLKKLLSARSFDSVKKNAGRFSNVKSDLTTPAAAEMIKRISRMLRERDADPALVSTEVTQRTPPPGELETVQVAPSVAPEPYKSGSRRSVVVGYTGPKVDSSQIWFSSWHSNVGGGSVGWLETQWVWALFFGLLLGLILLLWPASSAASTRSSASKSVSASVIERGKR